MPHTAGRFASDDESRPTQRDRTADNRAPTKRADEWCGRSLATQKQRDLSPPAIPALMRDGEQDAAVSAVASTPEASAPTTRMTIAGSSAGADSGPSQAGGFAVATLSPAPSGAEGTATAGIEVARLRGVLAGRLASPQERVMTGTMRGGAVCNTESPSTRQQSAQWPGWSLT
jgi:hypothetical protein